MTSGSQIAAECVFIFEDEARATVVTEPCLLFTSEESHDDETRGDVNKNKTVKKASERKRQRERERERERDNMILILRISCRALRPLCSPCR